MEYPTRRSFGGKPMTLTDTQRQALLRIEADPERQCEADEYTDVNHLFAHGLIRDTAAQARFFDRRHVVTDKGLAVMAASQ